MGDLYYIGDTVTLAFKIEANNTLTDRDKPVTNPNMPNLTKFNVSIFNEDGEIVHEDAVTKVDNEISYIFKPPLTKHAGDYAAFFNMVFATGQESTYKMPFTVLPKGIERKGMASQLDKNSTDDAVEQAMGADMRSARRIGEHAKDVYNRAQESIGRRMEK